MGTDLDPSSSSSSPRYHVDDDYIDMEVISSSNNFCYSPQNREFEFQMSSICKDKDAATFPADELFYKGKLLPLHLPPRLQMIQKLLQNPPTNTAAAAAATTYTFYSENDTFQENYSVPFISFPTTTNITNTTLESCNISPSKCYTFSCELNPDDYFFKMSTETNSFIGRQTPTKKSWTKKLMRSLLLGKKLKASSAYLKSLSFFNKSGCANESFANAEPEVISKDNNNNNRYTKVGNKNSSFANILMKSIEKEMGSSEIIHSRRSFSGAIQRHSTTNYKALSSSSGSSSSSSSFSFSSSSNGFCDLQLLKRSNSANSDIESSIEGAIAYCKKSHQQLFCSA